MKANTYDSSTLMLVVGISYRKPPLKRGILGWALEKRLVVGTPTPGPG